MVTSIDLVPRTAGLVSSIGRTPLVPLERIGSEVAPVELLAKAEQLNPGHSIKDRPALGMILAAERTGRLARGRAILDATSGNTGIALAWIGTTRGYRVTLCLPGNASPSRLAILRALGAEVVLTDPQESHAGAYHEAGRMAREHPDRYWYANQYDNPENWRAHYATTGVEILEQTGGRVTHFVAGIGTSGTLMGVGRRLRETIPSVGLVGVQPDAPLHGLEGLKHLPTAFRPSIYDPAVPDELAEVRTEDAQAMARRLAAAEGLFVGTSSGANVLAALRLARGLERGVVVTVLCDHAGPYLEEPYWREAP